MALLYQIDCLETLWPQGNGEGTAWTQGGTTAQLSDKYHLPF